MRIDIMTDIETLGNKSDSTIIQIAAMSFDIETGELLDSFNEIADITKNKTLNVTGSTLKWWLNTNKELLTELINKGLWSSEEILSHFHDWINLSISCTGDEVYLWGNGILFDNKMIQNQLGSIGLDCPIFYRNDRDMRTIVDLASNKLGISEKDLREKFRDESLVAHDAYDDVKYQINVVSQCYKLLTQGE